MFLELIATFVAGLGAAGFVMGLNLMTGGRLPRALIPVAAGAAMIGYAIWSEYSWAGRTVAGLPPGVVEVTRVEERIPFKPWTYLVPQTTRLMAVDAGGAAARADKPGVKLVNLYLFARWQPARAVPVLVDCAGAARADATDTALANPDQADWRSLPGDDPLLSAVCSPPQ